MRSVAPRLVLLLGIGVCLSVCFPVALRAEERIGEGWEQGILDGVASQEQERERAGRTPEAVLRQAELLAARRADPTTRVVRLYLLARAYGLTGDARSAAATYREVLSLAPRCYFAYHDLAMLELQQEPPRRAQAERYLRQALRIHPRYVTAHRKLARMLLDDGRKADALASLRRVVTLDPADLQAHYYLAKALLELGQLPEAEREIGLLVRRQPKAPAFRELKGDLYMARGRLEDALAVYERLARQHPSAAQPLHRYLRVLNRLRLEKEVFERDRWLWALEGLLRTVSDDAERKQIRAAIEELRRPVPDASEIDTEGPPTDEVIVAALERAPAEDRAKILRYVYARDDAPGDRLLQVLLRRLVPATEPSGEVRRWVLRVLARYGGYGVVGMVRHALNDPEPAVRPVAADALLALAATHPAARGAGLLVLGLYTNHPDRALASAARRGVLELARATLDEGDADAYAGREEAFRTWWRGPAAGEAKIEALESFSEVGDRFPEDVLVPYLRDGDDYVVQAAWRAMAESGRAVTGLPATSAARRRWFAEMPPYEEGAIAGPAGGPLRERLRAWAARKPGS